MKILSLKLQILASIISTAHGKPSGRWTNAWQGHTDIFVHLPRDFFATDYLREAVQQTYPKKWQKWIERKSGQLIRMGESLKRPYERCGTNAGYSKEPPSFIAMQNMSPDSTSSDYACAMNDFMFEVANIWTETHLSSCKSYQKNNHFGRRLSKWYKIYRRAFGCEQNSIPSPKCGSYAQDEEITIENDKCVLDLGTFPGSFPNSWSFSFELKIHSLPEGPTDPNWFFQILAGIDI